MRRRRNIYQSERWRGRAFAVRISECEQILSKESISRKQVCKFSFLGVPDKLRPLTWRLLWNYLPYSRRDWTAEREPFQCTQAAAIAFRAVVRPVYAMRVTAFQSDGPHSAYT